jgi:predicted nucleic acid-binding protein
MNFADTNWLEALYFESPEPEQQARESIAQRFMRRNGGSLAISQFVYLEARNVFSRTAGESDPEEWRRLLGGLNSLIYLDPLDWDLVRRDAFMLFERHAHKLSLGTMDVAIFASARLAGATRILTFDETLKALASAEGLPVFPPLSNYGKILLSKLS